jgi:hypothetical protein
MAKDRFSNQKGTNWNPAMKYSADSMRVNQYISKRCMEASLFSNLTKLLNYKLNDWESNYVQSLLKINKELTLKQEKTLKNIIKKYKQSNIQPERHR